MRPGSARAARPLLMRAEAPRDLRAQICDVVAYLANKPFEGLPNTTARATSAHLWPFTTAELFHRCHVVAPLATHSVLLADYINSKPLLKRTGHEPSNAVR